MCRVLRSIQVIAFVGFGLSEKFRKNILSQQITAKLKFVLLLGDCLATFEGDTVFKN